MTHPNKSETGTEVPVHVVDVRAAGAVLVALLKQQSVPSTELRAARETFASAFVEWELKTREDMSIVTMNSELRLVSFLTDLGMHPDHAKGEAGTLFILVHGKMANELIRFRKNAEKQEGAVDNTDDHQDGTTDDLRTATTDEVKRFLQSDV